MLARIAQSALAAGVSWELALQIPGHGQPFFAPIAAVIGLGAQRGRCGRQAIEMILGVAIGILIGAGLIEVAGAGAWQIVVATIVTFVLATAVDAPPVVRVQSAASAILVVALHRPGGNIALQRLVDPPSSPQPSARPPTRCDASSSASRGRRPGGRATGRSGCSMSTTRSAPRSWRTA